MGPTCLAGSNKFAERQTLDLSVRTHSKTRSNNNNEHKTNPCDRWLRQLRGSVRINLHSVGTNLSNDHSGLEADQKVIAAHGCYAMTATTALTAQNTKGVYDIHHTPPEFLQKQIDACIEDVGVDVVKTGAAITSYLRRKSLAYLICRHAGFCGWHSRCCEQPAQTQCAHICYRSGRRT